MIKEAILLIFFMCCFANGFFDLIEAIDNDIRKIVKWIKGKIK